MWFQSNSVVHAEIKEFLWLPWHIISVWNTGFTGIHPLSWPLLHRFDFLSEFLFVTEVNRIKMRFVFSPFLTWCYLFLWDVRVEDFSGWEGNPMHGLVQKVAVLSFTMVWWGMTNLFSPPSVLNIEYLYTVLFVLWNNTNIAYLTLMHVCQGQKMLSAALNMGNRF